MEIDKAVQVNTANEGSPVRIRCTFDSKIFHNQTSKYCVVRMKTADTSVPSQARSQVVYSDHLIRFTATGHELPFTDSVELMLEGTWTDSKYGMQLQVDQYHEIIPPTEEGILNYLSSGLLKNIGGRTAEQIVARFGVDSLRIIEEEPHRLLEIRGISEERLEEIKKAYAESSTLRGIITLLAPFKLTPKAALKIYNYFGTQSIDILKKSPYALCQIPGYGFLRVDAIMQKNNCDFHDPMRVRGALYWVIEDAKSDGGHLFLERETLIAEALRLLNNSVLLSSLKVKREEVENALQNMILDGSLVLARNISSGALSADASQITKLRLRIKTNKDVTESRFYFITDTETNWNQTKSVAAKYIDANAVEDSYVELVFDMSTNAKWTGTITQLRLDPMNGAGEFWIDSIELMELAPMGEYSLVFCGEEIRLSEAMQVENGVLMASVKELSKLFDEVRWSERLDDSAVEVYIPGGLNASFYSLSYSQDTIIADGQSISVTQGASVIEGEVYIPLEPFLDAVGGYECSYDESSKTMSVYSLMADSVVDLYATHGWYFDVSNYGVTGVGDTTVAQLLGVLNVTAGADGKPTVETDTVGLKTDDITHVQVSLRGAHGSGEVQVTVTLTDGTSVECDGVAYTCDENQFTNVVVDMTTVPEWVAGKYVDKITVALAQNVASDTVIAVNSIELLDKNVTILAESSYFTNGLDGWIYGGDTGIGTEDGVLVVTRPSSDNRPRIWSSNKSGSTYTNGLNLEQGEITHIRIRMKVVIPSNTEVADKTATLYVQPYFSDSTGTEVSSNARTVEYEAGTEEYLTFTIDVTEGWEEGNTLQRFYVQPYGSSGNDTLWDANAKIYIDFVQYLKKTTDNMEETTDNYDVIMRSEFSENHTGWSGGGGTTLEIENGELVITAADGRPRFATYAPIRPLNYTQGDITHVRVRVKVTVPENANVSMDTNLMIGLMFGDETWYSANATKAYTIVNGEYVDVLVDIREAWTDPDAVLNGLYILPWGGSNSNPLYDAGCGLAVEYVECLKLVEPEEPVEYTTVKTYTFDAGVEGWNYGGSGANHTTTDGAYVLTNPTDGKPRINHVESYLKDEITHVRVRIKITFEDDTNIAAGTMATMMVAPQLANDTESMTWWSSSYTATTEYDVTTGDYVDVLVDISQVWGDTYISMNKLHLYPFGSAKNDTLIDAGAQISIDSIEYLKLVEPAEEIEVKVNGSGITSSIATLNAPADGWVEGENTFTVSAEVACVVAVSNDGGVTYTRLTATADGNGGYSFTANLTADSQIAVVVAGDANGDGKITNADAGLIKAVALELETADALMLLTMDVNNSGTITNADAGLLTAVALGLEDLSW